MKRNSACVVFVPLACVVFVVALTQPAAAVIVAGSYANQSDATVNITPPSDDPGFYNVGSVGSASAIYLGTDAAGDAWVLSAEHVTLGPTTFSFPDASNPSQIDTGTYSIVPNSGITLKNPAGSQPGAGADRDLILYRIDPSSSPAGLPNLPRLDIATTAPSLGDTVIGIGRGIDRSSSIASFDASFNTPPIGPAVYSGYTLGSTHTMRWGDNLVSTVGAIANVGSMSHPVYVNAFETAFNQNGGTASEFQATTGDSGGGVFDKIGGQWYLSGMIDAVTPVASNQPATDAIFGSSTVIADLSVYASQIQAVVPEPGTFVLVALAGTRGLLALLFVGCDP